jgi:hypothetical protein
VLRSNVGGLRDRVLSYSFQTLWGKEFLAKEKSIQFPYSEVADKIEKELSPCRIIHVRAFVSVVVRNLRSQVADL